MTVSAGDELLALVRDDVLRAGVASEWLAVLVQAEPPPGRWLTRDALLADDARRMGELVDDIAGATPGLDPRLVWRGVPVALAWPAAAVATRLLEATGRLLRLDATSLRLRLSAGGEPPIDGIWIASAALAVEPGDVLADRHAGVRVADRRGRLAALAADLVAFTEPVVAVAAARARVGAHGLWGAVADCVLGILSERRPTDPGPGAPRARVRAFTAASAGTPLARRPRWTEYEHGGEPHATMRYCACCLAYRRPSDPDAAPRADGADPRWDRYCMACPLIPDEEVAHRGRYRLDRPPRG